MSASIRQLGRSPREVVGGAAILLLALAIGGLSGYRPSLGVAGAGALIFALIVIWDLPLGVALFLLIAFLDSASGSQNVPVSKAAGAVLAGSWLATVATRRRDETNKLALQQPVLTAALLAFIAWSVMSGFWAESINATVTATLRYALDALLVPIVFWGVRERSHVFRVFGVFVTGTLLSVAWGITHSKEVGTAAAAQVGRLDGANVEANVLATLLIVCMVFACALALASTLSRQRRILALMAAFAAMTAFFATFSRGGMIALAVVLVSGCFYAGRSRPAFIAVVISTVLVGAIFLQNTSSTAVARLASTNTSGRADVWKVGLRMARANPIIGVGSGNYQVAEPHYFLSAPGALTRADIIIDTPYPAHNIYLHVWAEMGFVGLTLLMWIVVLSLRSAVKAVKLFRRQGDRSLEVLGRGLVLALIGILAADFFVSDQYSKQLWFLLAMGPALLAIARRSAASGDLVEAPAVPPQRGRFDLAQWR